MAILMGLAACAEVPELHLGECVGACYDDPTAGLTACLLSTLGGCQRANECSSEFELCLTGASSCGAGCEGRPDDECAPACVSYVAACVDKLAECGAERDECSVERSVEQGACLAGFAGCATDCVDQLESDLGQD